MTTNRLAIAEPKRKLSAQEWCDIGNDRLTGRIPYDDGQIEIRHGLKWIVENNQPRLVSFAR
jgi:hypothetical protein